MRYKFTSRVWVKGRGGYEATGPDIMESFRRLVRKTSEEFMSEEIIKPFVECFYRARKHIKYDPRVWRVVETDSTKNVTVEITRERVY